MEELEKLINSLKLLDRIHLVNHDLAILKRQIKELPNFVEHAAIEVIKEKHLQYIPELIVQVKKNLYKHFNDEFSEKINLLEQYKEEIFYTIMHIQNN